MKKQFNAIQKKAFTFLVALVIVVSSVDVYALPGKGAGEVKQAEVTYKGVQDKFLVFNVDFKNELTKDFLLVIRNEHNEILLAKKYDAKPLNTNIFLSDINEDCKLTFTIRIGKKELAQTFEINNKVRTISELEVRSI